MYTIEELKATGNEPYYFGLGFIQFNLTPRKRLNFYHMELGATVDIFELHNHRYAFRSTILSGVFHQSIYTFREERFGMCTKRFVSCKKDEEAPAWTMRGEVDFVYSASYEAGSQYIIPKNVFHRVSGDHCVTEVERMYGAVDKFAMVIAPNDYSPSCPFASTLTTDECWDLVKEML